MCVAQFWAMQPLLPCHNPHLQTSDRKPLWLVPAMGSFYKGDAAHVYIELLFACYKMRMPPQLCDILRFARDELVTLINEELGRQKKSTSRLSLK